MDGEFLAANPGRAVRRGSVPRDGRELRTECRPGGNGGDVMWEERGLRRLTQAEHGEAAVARDEADGERQGGKYPAPATAPCA